MFDTLWESCADELPFEESNIEITIHKDVLKKLSPLEGAPLREGERSCHGQIGVNDNDSETSIQAYMGGEDTGKCKIL